MSRISLLRLSASLNFFLLTACQAQIPAKPTESPAILTQPNPATREELNHAVARMLNVPSVTIAAEALQNDSLMVIEKVHPRDSRGLPMNGRDLDKPEQFRLIKINDDCVLVRLRTGARETLRKNQCTATALHE